MYVDIQDLEQHIVLEQRIQHIVLERRIVPQALDRLCHLDHLFLVLVVRLVVRLVVVVVVVLVVVLVAEEDSNCIFINLILLDDYEFIEIFKDVNEFVHILFMCYNKNCINRYSKGGGMYA